MTQFSYDLAMRYAVELAQKSRFSVYPNPNVGAVLVKNGTIVAQGWHKDYGGPHAEIVCLEDAKAKNINPSECTLVVTLEPCNHYGKTPPCTEAIINAGIKHVVIGFRDPNPKAKGGLEYLQSKGIQVETGVEEGLCRDLIADFLCWQEQDRPYILLKLASTLDGRIATRTGHSQWITCTESREQVQFLRKKFAKVGGAVIVGGGTFRDDNPQLSVRYPEGEDGPQPLACVVTSRLPTVDLEYNLLQKRPQDVIFYTSPAAAASPTAMALMELGAKVWSEQPQSRTVRQPPLDILVKRLYQELHCPYILCEGGGKLALSFLQCGLVDEFQLHLAPSILGDNEAKPLFEGISPLTMEDALSLRIIGSSMHGQDLHIVLRPK